MPISLGQSSITEGHSGLPTFSASTFNTSANPISVSQGSSIYVAIQVSDSQAVAFPGGVVDNESNTFTRATFIQFGGGGSIRTEIWYFDNVNANANYSVTVTIAASHDAHICVEVIEVKGAANPSLDQANTNSNSGQPTSLLASATVTTTQANDVAILSVVSANNGQQSFTADQVPTSPDNTVDFVIKAISTSPSSGQNVAGAALGSGAGPTDFTSLVAIASYTMGANVIGHGSSGVQWAAAIVSIKEAPIICLLADTEILMQDGSIKKIQEIERYDIVQGNLEGDHASALCYPVSKVCKQSLNSNTLLNLIKIQKDALGLNCPNHDLYITENHPIFYNDKRRPAKCFQNLPGVEFLRNISISELCTDYSLYDLQFDVEGSYVANYLQVQSRSPFSVLTPLPRDLYLDDQLYQDDIRVWDSYDHVKELDLTLL